MKKIAYLIIALTGLGMMFSCEKENDNPILDMDQANPPAFMEPTSGTAYVLTEEMADSTIAFSWSSATYNITELEDTKYTVQVDLPDSNFVNAKELINTTDLSFSITYAEINNILVGMGLEADSAYDVALRIHSFLNTDSEYSYQYSDPITLNFTPYSGDVEVAKLYVPGDYQGWNPAEAPVIYDFDGDGVFNGYIVIPEGGTLEFKFTSAPNWDETNYGFGGEGMLDTDPGAGNLAVPEGGGYMFEVDINNLTWTYELQNWGVIGQWLNWEEDIDMVWDIETQDLYVTVEGIPPAEDQRFKFRANDAWDINLGAVDPPDGETLTEGGLDIPIPDGGTITFYLRFTTPQPTYSLEYLK